MRKYLLPALGMLSLYCNGQNQGNSLQSDFQNFSQGASTNINNSSSLPVFNRKQETVGSQFIFKHWVKGMVTNKQGISFSNGLFNYDKINKNLYLLKGDTTLLINKYQVQTIRLYGEGDSIYVLEKIPSLKTDDLYIVLSKGVKYSLMKSVETKLVLANFHTNGMFSSGNNYDEFKDEYKYFVIFPDGLSHEVSLKKKSIKAVLETEKDKVDQFYKAHGDDEQNESFLSRLITSLDPGQ